MVLTVSAGLAHASICTQLPSAGALHLRVNGLVTRAVGVPGPHVPGAPTGYFRLVHVEAGEGPKQDKGGLQDLLRPRLRTGTRLLCHILLARESQGQSDSKGEKTDSTF